MEKMERKIGEISLSLSQSILENAIGSIFSGKEKDEIQERAVKNLKIEIDHKYE